MLHNLLLNYKSEIKWNKFISFKKPKLDLKCSYANAKNLTFAMPCTWNFVDLLILRIVLLLFECPKTRLKSLKSSFTLSLSHFVSTKLNDVTITYFLCFLLLWFLLFSTMKHFVFNLQVSPFRTAEIATKYDIIAVANYKMFQNSNGAVTIILLYFIIFLFLLNVFEWN
jgi:hypothetical protein